MERGEKWDSESHPFMWYMSTVENHEKTKHPARFGPERGYLCVRKGAAEWR